MSALDPAAITAIKVLRMLRMVRLLRLFRAARLAKQLREAMKEQVQVCGMVPCTSLRYKMTRHTCVLTAAKRNQIRLLRQLTILNTEYRLSKLFESLVSHCRCHTRRQQLPSPPAPLPSPLPLFPRSQEEGERLRRAPPRLPDTRLRPPATARTAAPFTAPSAAGSPAL